MRALNKLTEDDKELIKSFSKELFEVIEEVLNEMAYTDVGYMIGDLCEWSKGDGLSSEGDIKIGCLAIINYLDGKTN